MEQIHPVDDLAQSGRREEILLLDIEEKLKLIEVFFLTHKRTFIPTFGVSKRGFSQGSKHEIHQYCTNISVNYTSTYTFYKVKLVSLKNN